MPMECARGPRLSAYRPQAGHRALSICCAGHHGCTARSRRDASMGEKVVATGFDLSDRQRYRQKLRQCLVGLERLLEEKRFDRPRNLMGLEIELNLADCDGLPCMVNEEVLERIASRDFQTELAQFNIEVNIAPHRLSGRVLDQLAEELRIALSYADRQAYEVGARIVMIGILPTLGAQ